MKKLLTILVICSSWTLVSCDNPLDIDPKQQLSTNQVFNTGTAARGALTGVYGQLQGIVGPEIIAEYQADNADYLGFNLGRVGISTYSTTSDNPEAEAIWAGFFEAILAANAVIANVPDVEDATFTEEARAQVIAEARFLRALLYFKMVNLYGHPYQVSDGAELGVPLVLEPFEGEIQQPERATVNEVHAQIQSDLEEAIPDLPDSFTSSLLTRGRATKGAARALLSRVYLYREEWNNAAIMADSVISSPEYALASDYSFYNANTPEDIFSIQNSTEDPGGITAYYEPAEQGGAGYLPFTANLEAAFEQEAGDLRYDQKEVADNGRYYTLKYNNATTDADNVPLIRVTEMYLNKAEALAELNGVNQKSVDLINELRGRANLSLWTVGTFTSKEDFLVAIANERRKELCFEGHRRMDLLRRGEALRPVGDPNFEQSQPGDDKTILPIPQRERSLNPNLVQNDGY